MREKNNGMVTFPNAKINLGLRVVEKREDGYHNLDTVFYPLPLQDALECIPAETDSFTSTGIPIPGSPTSNLCIKAIELLRKDFPSIPPLSVHLHKKIPMGAGLGGGSSDGAFMLKMLNDTFRLGLSQENLIQYALRLGSDCPFFIINSPVAASGRGEKMHPIECSLSHHTLLLVHPGIHIGTAEAFARIRPQQPLHSCSQIVSQPLTTWRDQLINDFEQSVFPTYPELAEIKASLYALGAGYASMTGTGSVIFAIFEKRPNWEGYFPSHYTVLCITQ